MWNIGIKTHTREELVQNHHTCENWYQINTDVKNWYLIATDVSDKTVKTLNRMQNAADLWGGGGILLYAIWNLTSCLFFTTCEILVRIVWRIGTNFSRAVRNWYLRFNTAISRDWVYKQACSHFFSAFQDKSKPEPVFHLKNGHLLRCLLA